MSFVQIQIAHEAANNLKKTLYVRIVVASYPSSTQSLEDLDTRQEMYIE